MNIHEQTRDVIGRERITCHASVCTDSLENILLINIHEQTRDVIGRVFPYT